MTSARTLGLALAERLQGDRRDAPALEGSGSSISYAEVGNAASAIADRLADLGIASGTHIGVLADDCKLIVPAMIGILARQCAFAILDPNHPPNLLRRQAEAAELRCLLVEKNFRLIAEQDLRGLDCTIVIIDMQLYAFDEPRRPSIRALLAAAPDRACYLYFTSGTSGNPKPILGRADSLLHFVDWEIAALGLDESVRVAQLTPPIHDPFLRDIFTPLVAGGTICMPESRYVVLSPVELGRWLDDAAIQLVHCTPTVFRNLCNGGLPATGFSRLRHVLIAGEPLRGTHLAAWYETVGDDVQLVNLYGPTETTLAKLHYFISPQDAGRGAIPIGQPIDGTKVRIMATACREAETDEIGELHIETAFGTLGYYRQPELNRLAFHPEPGETASRPITYRTGDLVKRLADGNIEFVGRDDRQSKVRGRRIDLGHIEDEISRRTEVLGCVVSAMSAESDTEPDRLVAFYVAERELEEQLVKRNLAVELPSFMIPDAWIRLDALPMNLCAKVHGDALAALLAAYDSASAAKVPAPVGSVIETRLLELWKELLRNDEVGLDDPFMDVGGDSLSIMLLIARLDEDYAFDLSLWQVFDDLTVRKLGALISEATVPAQPLSA